MATVMFSQFCYAGTWEGGVGWSGWNGVCGLGLLGWDGMGWNEVKN